MRGELILLILKGRNLRLIYLWFCGFVNVCFLKKIFVVILMRFGDEEREI